MQVNNPGQNQVPIQQPGQNQINVGQTLPVRIVAFCVQPVQDNNRTTAVWTQNPSQNHIQINLDLLDKNRQIINRAQQILNAGGAAETMRFNAQLENSPYVLDVRASLIQGDGVSSGHRGRFDLDVFQSTETNELEPK